jgi:hypothetical protein
MDLVLSTISLHIVWAVGTSLQVMLMTINFGKSSYIVCSIVDEAINKRLSPLFSRYYSNTRQTC